jgi:UDP-N-acetylmuramoylalanine--D-glutamate ligase
MISQRSWHDDWAGLHVAVLGLGKSGFSVADTLCELGAEVTVFAQSANPQFTELLELIGAKLVLSDSTADLQQMGQIDLAVISPGFAPNHPTIQWLTQSGIPMLTDIDLAWRLRDKTQRVAKWITITGTNGKTTTTELVTHMLQTAGLRAVSCGNIGNPILDAIRDPEGFDFLVVEISSFQLHYSGELNPVASAFLNLAPDHIDWHGSEQAYFQAKAKVYQGTELAIVYNAADEKTLLAAEAADVIEGCRAVAFTTSMPSVSMVGYVEDFLVDRAFITDRYSAALEIAEDKDLAEIGVLSDHLRANVAAATALARAVGVEPALIKRAITSFELSPHRIQKVLEKDGVLFIDDSKATNAHAANASLASFESIVWIVGGLLKGVDPTPLLIEHQARLKAAVVIGADTLEIEGLFAKLLPNLPLRVISGEQVMEQAVAAALDFAGPGDTVLLAPAAASMDQFQDYADRGNQFQAEVRRQVI